ncbi:MAG TPA: host attachment protein, partial [Kofleriaceae bacterium]|nr:host attachment protein [Kofleriaceae bacterium]
DAPVEALRSLARFLTTSEAVPPWRWARELFEDGVVDTEFGLTPRGRRAIARDLQPEDSGTHRISVCFCVVAADAGRARILTLESETAADEPTAGRLVEISDLSNPARRARDKDLFAESRPGVQRESPAGPTHGVDDRRGGQRQEADKKFAELVAEQAEAAWRQYPACKIVVVAPPRMLGNLRPAIARRRTGASVPEIQELGRDLSRLAPPALHDALAEAGILPARGRTGAGGLTPGPNGPAR